MGIPGLVVMILQKTQQRVIGVESLILLCRRVVPEFFRWGLQEVDGALTNREGYNACASLDTLPFI